MRTEELDAASAVDVKPSPTPAENRPECILLIDDSEEGMLLVQQALQDCREEEYRLKWAKTLTEGLEQISSGGVELVLLDLGLPECSGPASYAWVREMARDVPVLVLTADLREETELSVTASGVEDYLVKDQVSGALLLQAIRIALYAKKEQKHMTTAAGKLTRRSLTELL
jgi:DNA-binding response OmpR family regulator